MAELVGRGRCGRRASVRAVGSGHSFTDCACTDGLMLDLGGMDRVLDADTTSGLVTVEAGITLHALGKRLAELGLAMENQGDIDSQTLAGAISTATHGTGARYRNISSQVAGHAAGDRHGRGPRPRPSEADPEALAAARVGIGCAGRGGRRDPAGRADLHARAHRRPTPAGRHAGAARRAARTAPTTSSSSCSPTPMWRLRAPARAATARPSPRTRAGRGCARR